MGQVVKFKVIVSPWSFVHWSQDSKCFYVFFPELNNEEVRSCAQREESHFKLKKDDARETERTS